MPQPDLLTAQGVGDMLGVSDETVRRWAIEGKIASITLPSGQRRFRRDDVEAILNPPPEADARGEAS